MKYLNIALLFFSLIVIRAFSSQETSDSSSSMELTNWMDAMDEHWLYKKFEALNSTQHRGDVVNMVAARPWGVPCGDPNQHDLPWGSCTLSMECDAEYRIYRGDYFCGRTQYVCCALQQTNYDLYQGFDMSFADSSFSTDSNEIHLGGSEEERRKRRRERRKRRKERESRKRAIRKNIKKIVNEIRRILNRAFRNGTTQRKRKTKELKKFIEAMKSKYRKDRKAIVSIHEYELVKIDEDLENKLGQIQDVNQAFMSNNTFRDIIINGTVNKEELKKLLRTHPELMKKLFKKRSYRDVFVNGTVDKAKLKKLIRTHPDLAKSLRSNSKIHKNKIQPKNLGRRSYVEALEDKLDENSNVRQIDEHVLEENKEEPNTLEYDLEYGRLYF